MGPNGFLLFEQNRLTVKPESEVINYRVPDFHLSAKVCIFTHMN